MQCERLKYPSDAGSPEEFVLQVLLVKPSTGNMYEFGRHTLLPAQILQGTLFSRADEKYYRLSMKVISTSKCS